MPLEPNTKIQFNGSRFSDLNTAVGQAKFHHMDPSAGTTEWSTYRPADGVSTSPRFGDDNYKPKPLASSGIALGATTPKPLVGSSVSGGSALPAPPYASTGQTPVQVLGQKPEASPLETKASLTTPRKPMSPVVINNESSVHRESSPLSPLAPLGNIFGQSLFDMHSLGVGDWLQGG